MAFPSRALLAAALSACILGAEAVGARAEVVVAAGHTVSLMTLSSVDPTCRANGDVAVTVIEQPRGGYIQIAKTKAFPNFNALNTRSRCNTLRLPATRVDYQSAGTYLGLDYVTIEAIYPDGGVKRIRVAVSVRPVAPGAAQEPPPANHADAAPAATPVMPHGPLGGEDALPARPKPRVRHAEAHPRSVEHPKCVAPCPGKAPQPASKPVETKPLLTPI